MRDDEIYGDIDWVRLAKVLWTRRNIILGGACAGALSVLAYTGFMPRVYQSKGFFEAGISPTVYKRCRETFSDVDRYFAFVSAKGFFAPAELALAQGRIRDSADLARLFEPVYGSEESLGNNSDPKVIGFVIKSLAGSPEFAKKSVMAMGEFIRDSLLGDALYHYVNSNFRSLEERRLKVAARLHQTAFKLRLWEMQKGDVEKIVRRYPEAGLQLRRAMPRRDSAIHRKDNAMLREDERAGLDEGEDEKDEGTVGYEFFSPATVDASISDLKSSQMRLSREKDVIELRLGFYQKAGEILSRETRLDGQGSFDLIAAFAREYARDTEAGKEVRDSLLSDMNSFSMTYGSTLNAPKMRFTAGPTKPSELGRKRGIIVLGVFLFLLTGLSASALFLEWWKENKQQIVEKIKFPARANGKGIVAAK